MVVFPVRVGVAGSTEDPGVAAVAVALPLTVVPPRVESGDVRDEAFRLRARAVAAAVGRLASGRHQATGRQAAVLEDLDTGAVAVLQSSVHVSRLPNRVKD